MLILGIESTCDETGASVVANGRRVLSNVVASSVNLQKKYGGVVPEVAAREQVKVIVPVVEEALERASEVGSEKWERRNRSGTLEMKKSHISHQYLYSHIPHLISRIDAIAVSYGPGLIGSLLIGVETAKALTLAWDKPLIPVNHLVGHIYANWLIPVTSYQRPETSTANFPLIALIVSGGHTDLVLMKKHGDFRLIGTTLDDSAGEAFDKVARLLDLGYPGGPEVEKVASSWSLIASKKIIKLPRPMINSNDFNFSFSGLKTAVVKLVDSSRLIVHSKAAIAQEFQKAVADVLVKKTIRATEKFRCKSIVVGGGVSANELLRSQLTDHGSRIKIPVLFPSKKLSVDNGAMIAAAAFFVDKKISPLKLQVEPSLHF